MRISSIFVVLLLAASTACQEAEPDSLKERIGDSAPGSRWIHDDWEKGRKRAEAEKKPLFVVFRCVP